MTSTQHPPASRVRRWAQGLLVAIVATVCAGATCDVHDTSGVHTMAVGTDTPEALSFSELGRLRLELVAYNDGATDAVVTVSAQAQTGGLVESDACELVETSGASTRDLPPVQDQCDVTNGRVPLVRDLNSVYTLVFAGGADQETGCLRWRTSTRSNYDVFMSGATTELAVFDANGDEVLPTIIRRTDESCSAFDWHLQFDASAASHTMELRSSAGVPINLVIQQDCEDRLTVPRACDGASSEVIETSLGPIAPGESATGLIGTTELGIGDLMVISAACGDATPGCLATLEYFAAVERLDCRVDDACSTGKVCTDDGYCVDTAGSGCQQTSSMRSSVGAWALVIFFGAVLGTRRKRRHRMGNRRRATALALRWLVVALGVTVVNTVVVAPRAFAADETVVYIQPQFHSTFYLGEVGRMTSGGLGMQLQQGIRFERAEGWVNLGTDLHLTSQPSPPFDRALQTFQIGIGTRYSAPFEVFRVHIGVAYSRMTFMSNPLVRFTGDDLILNGIGADIGVRYEEMIPIGFEVTFSQRTYFGSEAPISGLSVIVAAGMSGRIN